MKHPTEIKASLGYLQGRWARLAETRLSAAIQGLIFALDASFRDSFIHSILNSNKLNVNTICFISFENAKKRTLVSLKCGSYVNYL